MRSSSDTGKDEGLGPSSQALLLVMKRTDHCEVRGTAYWWKDFQKTFKRLSKVFVPTLTTSTQDLEREYKSHQLVD
jgi:hypothetical protein